MENKELLEILRSQIDTLDTEILHLFSRRFQIVQQIGDLKKQDNIPALQESRWNQLLQNLIDEASEIGVSHEFVEDIWNRIHSESLKIEK